ncbi:hypothetical protein Clacol_010237 [Clathrus columnatus]|uniref:Alcohol acetyltransferase n=1 Tax=Clathrus columnatus TaxID=1419009 RepID=A0AAV5ATJ2_9AGAM|nr:hypothetical protein Clacol_010237 [Clathrus columnatus]
MSIGVSFKAHRTSREAVVNFVREAIGRFRFFSPIVACSKKIDQEQPLQQSYIYKPASNAEEVKAWTEATLTIQRGNGRDLRQCLAQKAEEALPYVHPNGHEQYFHSFLICHEEENVYSFTTNLAHGFVDGRPVINFLRFVMDTIVSPNKDKKIQELEWGSEWKSLPEFPATLARRNLNLQLQSSNDNNNHDLVWEQGWQELKQKIEKIFDRKKLGEALKPTRHEPTGKGPVARVIHQISPGSLDSIKSELKNLGYSMAHLIQATHILTVLQRNRPLKPESYVTLDATMIDTTRFFPPEYPGPLTASSRTGFVPLIIEAKEIDWDASIRDQLISIMKSVNKQFKDYLRYPQLTLINTIGPTKPDVAPMHPHTCIISYIGVIDLKLPATILNETGDVALEITNFLPMHRHAGGFQRPCVEIR